MRDDTAEQAPAVPYPTHGVDPRVAAAAAIQAGRGVYVLLAGSGLSTAAGIKTGWQVVQDLIRRVAVAEGVDPGGTGRAIGGLVDTPHAD